MTTSKSLPARPSLESLRKQAKKLARDIAAGGAGAIARARAQLPQIDLPLSQRNAQLVLAREYGFAGWQDLTAEVSKRLGNGLERAAEQARRVIHNNDVEREDTPHSTTHPPLATAGRSAAFGGHGRPLAGEALVRRIRRACAGRSRQSRSLQRPARAGAPPV